MPGCFDQDEMNGFIYDLIEKLEEKDERSILLSEDDPRFYYAISQDRANLMEWLPLKKDMDVLCVGAEYGAFCDLAELVKSFDIFDPGDGLLAARKRMESRGDEAPAIGYLKQCPKKLYDLVLIPYMDEELMQSVCKAQEPSDFLAFCAGFLKAHGSLIYAMDDSCALKYFSGEEKREGECVRSLSELEAMERGLAFSGCRRYYPLPDMSFARDIFSDAYLPGRSDFRGIYTSLSADSLSLCDQEALYGRLSEMGEFRAFAPSFLTLLMDYHGEQLPELVLMSAPRARELSEEELPIYIRYNRRRAERFRLRTEIFESEVRRYVRKTALSKDGNEHILSFEHKFRLLSETMKGRDLRILEPKIGRGPGGLMYAEFDYLKGRPLSEILSAEIEEGRAPVGRIKDELERLMGTGVTACHDLDLVFENVMVTEEARWLIDYEWVFDIAPNRDHVKYRMLRYWYESCRESLYAYKDVTEFLALFGIKGEVLSDCEEREESFQSFVNGDTAENPSSRFLRRQKTVAEIKADLKRLEDFTEWNLRLQDEVEEHKTAIRRLHETERLSQNHITNLENIISAKDNENQRLASENAYLMRHRSLYARIMGRIKAHFDRTAPQGTKKRKLLHYAHNTLRHPLTYMKRYLTRQGRLFIAGDFAIGGEFEEGGLLRLPKCEGTEEPLVSIVIPAYNQVAYTYACIRSIIEHTDPEKTPYEVILADDVSTDATAEIEKYIEGLVISRAQENTGFLKNCNRAAALSRGRYIFFLNNDTKVTDGWLESLTDLMEQDDSIGMCGSKLVYPDGRLQEAGGIIWSDASGWNYGRLDDPEKPQYNYLKEVDYISGAAIMIRRELWQEIGGFDERYAPAYCEDSDLAFEVRKHGKRVVYQPRSVVIHFEGISNGTDVQGSGLKRYQLINNEKFREKWAEELKKQSVNDGNPDPFTARDRSQEKKCILVIDHYVPTWDKDAGSRTTYQYIRMFLKKGFNVKFLGDNFLHEEPYTTGLQQLGVEVLYGNELKLSILDWIKEHSAFIDIAYLNRPHIAAKYIDFIKDETDIKCIYYGHDLHFMRLQREYELNDDIRTKREAEYWKGVELSVMDRADMVYYPSEEEISAIRRLRPDIRAKAITAYTWDEFPELPFEKEKRDGLLFVGGFAHPPNEDGMLWFAKDIWPLLKAAIPDIRLYVAGSHVTERVEALKEISGIEILGFVSDERLTELYNSTRLVVVPLRYGAGVKGKVVEALYHSSAVVTTETGAEGIPDADSVMAIARGELEAHEGDALNRQSGKDGEDNAGSKPLLSESFAEDIIKLYSDEDFCLSMRLNAARFVREHYSLDAAWDVIKDDFS